MGKKTDSKLPAYHCTLSDGIEFAMNAYDSELRCNSSDVVYDTQKNCCLVIDLYGVGLVSDEDEARLIKMVKKNPERFIEFPTFSSQRVYDLMWDFAEECDSAPLQRALEGARPMATFKIVADKMKLLDRWYTYEYKKKENFFKNWLERHEIKVA